MLDPPDLEARAGLQCRTIRRSRGLEAVSIVLAERIPFDGHDSGETRKRQNGLAQLRSPGADIDADLIVARLVVRSGGLVRGIGRFMSRLGNGIVRVVMAAAGVGHGRGARGRLVRSAGVGMPMVPAASEDAVQQHDHDRQAMRQAGQAGSPGHRGIHSERPAREAQLARNISRQRKESWFAPRRRSRGFRRDRCPTPTVSPYPDRANDAAKPASRGSRNRFPEHQRLDEPGRRGAV